MKNNFPKYLKTLRDWRKISGYSNRNILNSHAPIATIEYNLQIPCKKLHDKKIVFLSDLHWDYRISPAKALTEQINALKPDWIIIGGDLISYSCFMDSAGKFLASLEAGSAKIAVYGNWDKKRKRWTPNSVWQDFYGNAGFRLLINEEYNSDGIHFYGTDDYKVGISEFKADETELFRILIAHNPDTLDILTDNDLKKINLIISGHTHGGQIRIPFFGALKTSSGYWKKFEYGRFMNKISGTEMIISSGIGFTWKNIRLFCQPEIVLINFVKK
ncbi:MAG: hypothetical protein A2017_10500 [Lentisphaerae bacterium GWF2_44_16]|nr:MAG: hypothetical protein A2017_10500 [Lentisphaerae bacterium GWF2_44_16]